MTGPLTRLQQQVSGWLFLPGDGGANPKTLYFNQRPDRRPSAILQPTDEADIVHAIHAAVDAGMPLGVVGGGHNPSASGMTDDGILVDMSALSDVSVDAESGIVRSGGGARWKEVDAATAPLGFATVGGDCCTVGVAGFTLGGGHGMLSRAHGLGCDNMVAARLVMADGTVRRVDAESEPDLFWALRGGGNGNFGVVVELEQRLFPLPETLRGGALIWSWDHARDVVRALRDLFAANPTDDLTLAMNLARFPFPDGPLTPVVYGIHLGGAEAEARDLASLRTIGPPVMDIFGDMPYTAIQTLSEEDLTGPGQGLRGLWKGGFVSDPLSDAAVDRIIDACESAPTNRCRVHIDQIGGGVISRTAPDETAYWHRNARLNIEFLALWKDPAEDETAMTWARSARNSLAGAMDGGVYPGYGDPELADWGNAYFGGNLPRLIEAKRRFDPDALFRFPQGLSELL